MFKTKSMKIDLGLKDLKLDFDLFKEPKAKREFSKPKPRYTQQPKRQLQRTKPRYTQQPKRQLQRTKPLLTKQQQAEAKQFLKDTGSAFNGLITKFKNRKMNKLEKEYFKTKEKSENLANEIHLRLGIEDHTNDIVRYETELKSMATTKEKVKEMFTHSTACLEFNLDLDNSKCICKEEAK